MLGTAWTKSAATVPVAGRRVGQWVRLAHLLCALLLACCFAACEICAREQWAPAVCRCLRVPLPARKAPVFLCLCAQPMVAPPQVADHPCAALCGRYRQHAHTVVCGGFGGGVGCWFCPRPWLPASCSARSSRRSTNHQATWGMSQCWSVVVWRLMHSASHEQVVGSRARPPALAGGASLGGVDDIWRELLASGPSPALFCFSGGTQVAHQAGADMYGLRAAGVCCSAGIAVFS